MKPKANNGTDINVRKERQSVLELMFGTLVWKKSVRKTLDDARREIQGIH